MILKVKIEATFGEKGILVADWGLWGASNTLFSYLSGGYMGVFTVKTLCTLSKNVSYLNNNISLNMGAVGVESLGFCHWKLVL